MIKEQYVSLDTAKMLKEAGFDEICHSFYEDNNLTVWTMTEQPSKMKRWLPRPTQSLAARWLRETHGIHVFPVYQYLPEKWSYVIQDMTYVNSEKGMKLHTDVFYSCEESLEAGLQEALKLIIKNK